MTTPEPVSFVLYCIIRRRSEAGQPERFLLISKRGQPAFPPTKLRPLENLYQALVRPMEEDLGLPAGSYCLERELPPRPRAATSTRYPGLHEEWYLYPITVSLTDAGREALKSSACEWWTLDEVLARGQEPNVLEIARALKEDASALGPAPHAPTMDALANRWAASHPEGVRVARAADIQGILAAGDRAFNLRVADPYLPYQRQGLGFTWSFFTARDKQDVHVHALPAVEIYGVLRGRLLLWHKSMNQRGVRVWRMQALGAGDWIEVEPLTCHLACWLDADGMGTVIKACSNGELAGVGRLGLAGKTSCQWKSPDGRPQRCTNFEQCAYPPPMLALAAELAKPVDDRDFDGIVQLAREAREVWGEEERPS